MIPDKAATAVMKADVDLNDPSLYVNRELSWLEFNRRVLEEARDPLTPSLEKLKFSSIFSSNLDEYFMVRVGGLFRAFEAGLEDEDPSGRTTRQQLDEIAEKVRNLVVEQYPSSAGNFCRGSRRQDSSSTRWKNSTRTKSSGWMNTLGTRSSPF